MARTTDTDGAVVRDLPDGPPDESGLTPRQRKVLRGHPRLRGAPRLPAHRARDRRGRRPDQHEQRQPPAGDAAEEGLPAPRPVPSPRGGRPHAGRGGRRRGRGRRARRAPASRRTSPSSAASPPVGPMLAEQAVEDVFPLPRELVGSGTLFMLKVVGDSMVDAAIADGDWVVVRQQPNAENGDIVAAMIDGEATVKTYKRRDGHVLAAAAQRRVRADPRRRRRGARAGRDGAAQGVVARAGRDGRRGGELRRAHRPAGGPAVSSETGLDRRALLRRTAWRGWSPPRRCSSGLPSATTGTGTTVPGEMLSFARVRPRTAREAAALARVRRHPQRAGRRHDGAAAVAGRPGPAAGRLGIDHTCHEPYRGPG